MAPGPPPKPTRLRVLEGNPGRRPLNEFEPQPAPRKRVPAAPKELGEQAKKEWRRLAKQLVRQGILTDLDMTAFTAYCQCYQRWYDASRQLDSTGLFIKAPNGMIMQNPLLPIINKAVDQMLKFMARFGLTPSDRSRLSVVPPDDELDALEEWLFGNQR